MDAIVRRALDLDQSGKSIRDVIEPEDWVLIKVNSVTNRGRTDQQSNNRGFFFGGFEHPGQSTDLRVVKSVIAYQIEHVGPRKITIAEGGREGGCNGWVTRLTYTGAQFGFHVEGSGSFRTEGFFMPEPILDADKVISTPPQPRATGRSICAGSRWRVANPRRFGVTSSNPAGEWQRLFLR